MVPRPSLLALTLALWGGAWGCNKHPLEAGRYALKAVAVQQDKCNLAPTDGTLWEGQVVERGEYVDIDYTLHCSDTDARQCLRLAGQYKTQLIDQPDQFEVDGTAAEVAARLRDAAGPFQCEATFVQVHLEAQVDAPDRFSGLLRVSYTLASSALDDTRCNRTGCDLLATFTATKEP